MFFYGIDMYHNGRLIRPNGRNNVDFLYFFQKEDPQAIQFLYAISY